MALWEWGPTALQEHIRKQKFVSCGSVLMQQHSSCPSSSSWLSRLVLEWLKKRGRFLLINLSHLGQFGHEKADEDMPSPSQLSRLEG